MSESAKERIDDMDHRIAARRTVSAPKHATFAEFLLADARVPSERGESTGYSFTGREALREVVAVIDQILNEKLADAEVSLAGGAQFGKTILELNFAAYVTAQQFRNFGLYLPDDDLVQGIVDTKFRPHVVDQIDWFARMVSVGKSLNKSGRAVNRKGAFLVTDGVRKSSGMIRGLGKVPTTFSMDIAAMDEVDDIQPRMAKFVRGRMSASDLRFVLKIGTQRIHARGMNQAWKQGSQGVVMLACPACGRVHNPEEEFPQIVRLRRDVDSSYSPTASDARVPHSALRTPHSKKLSSNIPTNTSRLGPHHQAPVTVSASQNPPPATGAPASVSVAVDVRRLKPTTLRDPSAFNPSRTPEASAPSSILHPPSSAALTWSGNFHDPLTSEFRAAHEPTNIYYLGCVACGAELDRAAPTWVHRQPGRLRQRQWSFRISQLDISAISLSKIVADFQRAVADPEEMVVFRCDVLGLPQSTAQALTPAVLDRARAVEHFTLAAGPQNGHAAYGGLDMGDRCWLFARVADPATPTKRLLALERMSAGDVTARGQALFHQLGLAALFIDERPLVNEARTLALALNGLQNLTEWPRITDPKNAYVTLPGGLTWDGKNARWLNLKCAVVRFTRNKLGAGIEQGFVFFEEGGQTKFVPCIACNRFETIDRVVREFLTPDEGVVEIVQGQARSTPALLLPQPTAITAPLLATLDAHLVAGSERVKETDGTLGDYVDACENHFLLADGYSKLAELICSGQAAPAFAYAPVKIPRNAQRRTDRKANAL